MRIAFIEIQNFRKLKSVRIDLADKETIFVGANNSGKTSAMTALGHFLINHKRFTVNDFTLSNWARINEIGDKWEKENQSEEDLESALAQWEKQIPIMDIWLDVGKNEIHHVSHLLPNLDWEEGKLGVRLRYEPNDITELYSEYVKARKHAEDTIKAAKEANNDKEYRLSLWPKSMMDYLERRLNKHFVIKAYTLDPDKLTDITDQGDAAPQNLPGESEPIEEPPFYGLIKINEIPAHRGFSDPQRPENEEDKPVATGKYKLSEQMRSYYSRHLDPSEFPEPHDIDALEAIEQAQNLFDEKLKVEFEGPIQELEDLGYPGVTDPKVVIATKIRPIESLNHNAALQYEVVRKNDNDNTFTLRLPEQYNGLGYQNLISMVFRLMSFRDDWMQVGKARNRVSEESIIPPLHLVIAEEPEAHLHVQVQQVFIRIAYDILRKHSDLDENKRLTTQLIVSTHSSHIAHECDFSALRYFRRFPAIEVGDVPITTVINVSDVFGEGDKTERFVIRYLKTTHCDLFFADAAILVEGPAERILLPYFIEHCYAKLRQSYITLLEIGGSHAHTLRSLIEHLGLTTLIITDIDSQNKESKEAILPARKQNQVTNNDTLKGWVPKEEEIDKLLDVTEEQKELKIENALSSIRVAYQCPINVSLEENKPAEEALPYTFEDALILENIAVFSTLEGPGLIKKFKEAIATHSNVSDLGQALFQALRGSNQKAKFALDLLFELDSQNFTVPLYIREGLEWLEKQLSKKYLEILPVSEKPKKDGKGKEAA